MACMQYLVLGYTSVNRSDWLNYMYKQNRYDVYERHLQVIVKNEIF